MVAHEERRFASALTPTAKMRARWGKALGYADSTWRDANTIGFHANDLESSLRKLLHAGHRVAICDQIQDPASRGAEVNRIVTPGYGVEAPRERTLFDLFD